MGTLISVSTDYAPFRKIIFLTFVKREEIMRTKLSSVPDAYFHFIPGQITFAYTAPPTRLLIQWWEYDSPPQLGERRSTAARAEARGRSHFKYSRSDLLSDQFIGLRIYYIGHLAGSECKIVNK